MILPFLCTMIKLYLWWSLFILLKQPGTKGPRQPWHDLHCRIEGPAAYDVLTNFEQRWRKATRWSEIGKKFKKISRWHDDALLKVDRISWITSPSSTVPNDHPSLWVYEKDDPENWNVQVNYVSKNKKKQSIIFLSGLY